MYRIQLRRKDSNGQLSYQILVKNRSTSNGKKLGKILENIGHYNQPSDTLVIKEDRALHWLREGAEPSLRVLRILENAGKWDRLQRLLACESMKDLVKEAEDTREELPCSKTRFPAPGDGQGKTDAHEHDYAQPEIRNAADDNDGELSAPPDAGKAVDENGSAPDLADDFKKVFNRPGKTQLDDRDPTPNTVRDPEFRLQRKAEEIQDIFTSEPDHGQQQWKMSLGKERRDPDTKHFLKEEYDGKCQICGFTFAKRNGEPHFVASYILDYDIIDNPSNVLCFCPNHFAIFEYGAVESPVDIIEQIRSYKGGQDHVVKFLLLGEEVSMCFSAAHVIDIIALLNEIENR